LGREFFQPLAGLDSLKSELASLFLAAGDYELVLDAARIWVHEQRFRVGVHLLRGLSTAAEASTAYSDIAEACLSELFAAVLANFEIRYGPSPGKGTAIIAMGKLGSREMTVTSDLDLIIVYDPDKAEFSTGPRPLAVQSYYARLTQAFVSALTVATGKGTLYKVDMRLRPSGRSGPVATSLQAFDDYQKNEAWIWEHMALLRARVIAGESDVMAATKAAIDQTLALPRDTAQVFGAVAEMRQRLAEAKSKDASNPWEVKFGAGRLMDVELLLQAGVLICGIQNTRQPVEMAIALADNGWLSNVDKDQVLAALDLYTILQQIGRLAVEGGFTPDKAGRGVMSFVLKATGKPDIDSLLMSLELTQIQMSDLIAQWMPKDPT